MRFPGRRIWQYANQIEGKQIASRRIGGLLATSVKEIETLQQEVSNKMPRPKVVETSAFIIYLLSGGI